MNASKIAEDHRPIQRIIFEKANFGACPVEYKISSSETWHPVQWNRDPELVAVRFSDGSVHHIRDVTQATESYDAEVEQYRRDKAMRFADDYQMGAEKKQSVFENEPGFSPGIDFSKIGEADLSSLEDMETEAASIAASTVTQERAESAMTPEPAEEEVSMDHLTEEGILSLARKFRPRDTADIHESEEKPAEWPLKP